MANVVITGTSQGIGLELTRLALEAGDRVLAVARPSDHLDQLHSLREKYHSQFQILETDLREKDAIGRLCSELSDWPSVDVLINNAGIYRKDQSVEDFLTTFETNTVLPFFITRTLIPRLREAAKPRAIHISSLMGSISQNSSGGSHSYRASKAALNMLSKGISVEEPWLISVVLHPGWVQTNMGGEQAPVTPAASAQGLWEVIRGLDASQSGSFFDYQGEKLSW